MPLETDKVVFDVVAATGDTLVDTDLKFATGAAAIKIGCEKRMTLVAGNWFANLEAGVDYFGYVFGREYNESKARSEFRDACLRVPGVSEVTKMELSLNTTTRLLTVTWEVKASYDNTVTVSGELIL